ncbi:MAG: hypothetical protein QOI11_3009, partial [Candidatus Eremiobacteraeota bacterium]|nr:hypothetical protein [Candidatus Eremiobacteraeota bacterium]
WLTVTALTVLLHVVPAFTDLEWRAPDVARGAAFAVPLAALALAAAFAAQAGTAVALAALVLAAALLAYVASAFATLRAPALDRTSAAIARALAITLGALGATALLGALLGYAYARGDAALLALAPSHALLGSVAWLTVLVSGVSARTFRPMLGARSRWSLAHVAAGGGLAGGAVLAALSAPWSPALLRGGVALAGLGALVYLADAFDILRRAQAPHAAPRAFVGAALAWLALATAGALAASWGQPVGRAAVVLARAGWLGQMVNAHLHHLGVRVLATLVLGEDDETRPWDLLAAPLSWTAFGTAQLAVVATAAYALGGNAALGIGGGACGLLAVAAMASNARFALRRARRFAPR